MSTQTTRSRFSKWSQFTLGGIAILLGVVIAGILLVSRQPPEKMEKEILAPLVETETVSYQDVRMTVKGYGTVQPSSQISIVPQVGGKVYWVNEKFKRGGIIRAGQPLVKIEPVDYRLAVQQAKADLELAKVELQTEQSEAEVAQKEWEKLFPEKQPESPLVYRKPQLQQKKAAVQSAKAGLEQAKLNLERTSLRLPEDVIITEESADKGQYIAAGQSIGQAYGIKTAEIPVPLQDSKLEWFKVPGIDVPFEEKGAEVQVTSDFAGKKQMWEGYVSRTSGEVSTDNRMISVIVEVPKPFSESGRSAPLFPGMFTKVNILGRRVNDIAVIPRKAIHERNKVWVAEDNHLYIRELDIIRTEKDYVYAAGGISDGAEIITSILDVVTNGMEIRVSGESESEEKINDPNE